LALWPNALIYLPYNISLPPFWGYKLFERRYNNINAWRICFVRALPFRLRGGWEKGIFLCWSIWGDGLRLPELKLCWDLGFLRQNLPGSPSFPTISTAVFASAPVNCTLVLVSD